MDYSTEFSERRERNGRALQAFGVSLESTGHAKTVRRGRGARLFTVGYERRTPAELVKLLSDRGIRVLIDVRQKAISRKPGFSARALSETCGDAGIEYEHWQELGSTEGQRDQLRSSGDMEAFVRRFKAHVNRHRTERISDLAERVSGASVALMCYERCHDECHRQVIAELVADEIDAEVVALQ